MTGTDPAVDGLFDIDPVALIYRGHSTRMHEMRCRECHELRPLTGGGLITAKSDTTGGGGYQYVVCAKCFAAPGRPGELARRGGVRGRTVKEAR